MPVTNARHALSDEVDMVDTTGDDAYPYPRDEFDVDDWEGPAGAHRAGRKAWLVAVPWLLAACVALLLIALFVNLGGKGKPVAEPVRTANSAAAAASATPSATATSSAAGATASASASASTSATSTAAAAVDKGTRISILNATRNNGLAHRLQRTLRSQGWNVTAASTYRASTPPTTVYYRSDTEKATAEAFAGIYGARVKQSQGFSAPITLMIGNDFPN